MNKQPHKYVNVIKAWADGEDIEWKYVYNKDWCDVTDEIFDIFNFNSPDVEWRIKPNKFSGKCRVALFRKFIKEPHYEIVDSKYFDDCPKRGDFICWLGDVIEYDVEY